MLPRITLMLVCCAFAVSAQTSSPAAPNAAPNVIPPPAAKNPTAVFHTSAGDIKCDLFMDKAPKTVSNFIGLATGQKDWTDPATGQPVHNKPLYDGTIFHRVIPNFMIQGGDPLGQGIGGPGYRFEDEFNSSLSFDRPGLLAMANSGPNTNGSQFFITDVPTPWLTGRHTIFGACDSNGQAVVKKIEAMPCQGGVKCDMANSKQINPVKITHIEIVMPGAAPATTASPKKSSTAPKK